MSDLTRQEKDAYLSGHWHDNDEKGSPTFGTEEDWRELFTAMTNALNGYKRPYYGPRKKKAS